MEIIRLLSEDRAGRKVAVEKAATVLRNGGIVMHATETCYGLAADVFNESAVEKIYQIKQMEKSKPVSMMVRNFDEAGKYGVFSDMAEKIAKRFWPGPLTVIVPRGAALPGFLNADSRFIGIRCSSSVVAMDLVEEFCGPVTTTSANISGVREVYNVMSFLHQMHSSEILPDLIIDSGVLEENLPSTIVKVIGNDVEFLRKGELSYKVRAVIE